VATADVVIKIDVRDGEAKRKLTALEARLNRLNKAGNGASGSFGDLGDEIDRTTGSTDKFNKELDKNERHTRKSSRANKGALKELRSLSNAFSPLIKFAKYAGAEFGVMAIAMVGLKVALVAGQAVAKGWQYLLQGMGVAAGVAIAGLAGVLGAIRQLNNAKIAPLAISAGAGAAGSGGKSFTAELSGLMGSGQLGMFKQQTLTGMAKSQYNSGNRVTADYRAMAQTLGNFAIGADDPDKALSGLTDTFVKAQKEGKFTEEMLKTISESSPQLGKALKETGMNAEQFFGAFSRGEIESLKPFKNALDDVNKTLIGRFKSSLRTAQESLTELGGTLIDQLSTPMGEVDKGLKIFLMKVSPAIQSVMGNIFPDKAGSSITRVFDYLATSIITNLPKLLEWGKSLKGIFGGLGGVFGSIGGWLEKATGGFNNLYENMLKPIGIEVWKTIEHAIMAFSDVMESTGGYGEKFKETIANIGEGLRGFIDGLAAVKQAMAPLVSMFMTMIGLVAKLAGALGPLKPLLALMAMGALTGRGKMMGPNGKPMKMGMGAGMLNFATLGGLSRAQRGAAPKTEEELYRQQLRDQRRANFSRRAGEARSNLWRAPKAAALGARNAAKTQMTIAAATGQQVGPYSGVGAHGIPYSARQIEAKSGGPAFRAGTKAFGQGVVKELKKMGPGAVTGLATAGMLAGGFIQGSTSKTSGVMQGLGGAIGGAGMGATIGSMIAPGVGTAVGAGLGAVVGGIGGIMSARDQAGKEKKAAKERLREGAFAGIPVNDQYALRSRAMQLRSQGKAYRPGEFNAQTKEMNSKMDALIYGVDNKGKQNQYQTSTRGKVIEDILDAGGDNTSISTDKGSLTKIMGGGRGEGFDRGSWSDEDKLKRVNQLLANRGELLDSEIQFLNSYSSQLQTSINIKKSGLEDEKAYRGQLEAFAQEMDTMAAQQDTNFGLISSVMGVTGDAASELASTMKWDLGKNLLTVQDLIQGLGYTMVDMSDATKVAARGADLMANRAKAAGRILADIMKPIEDKRAAREQNQKLNAAGQQLFNYTGSDTGLMDQYAEDFTEASMTTLLQAYTKGDFGTGVGAYDKFVEEVQKSYYNSLGDAIKGGATTGVVSMFGAEASRVVQGLQKGQTGFSTRMQYDPAFALGVGSKTGAAADKYNTLRGQGVSEEDALTQATNGLKTEISVLSGGRLDVNTKEMGDTLSTLIQGQLSGTEQAFLNALNKAKVQFQGKIDLNLKDGKGQVLDSSTFNVTTSGSSGPTLTAAERQAAAEAGVTLPGDTSTSRMARTMGKHMAFNGKIAGNRTVTSGLRNWNLGSGMSDHKFGNAYDLTGDNLGQYASLVNGSGGFAEFHGAAGGRHLHVVPPSGDTSSPAMVSGDGGGSTTNNYNISVQGGTASADEVARKVVTIIQETQRSNRERA